MQVLCCQDNLDGKIIAAVLCTKQICGWMSTFAHDGAASVTMQFTQRSRGNCDVCEELIYSWFLVVVFVVVLAVSWSWPVKSSVRHNFSKTIIWQGQRHHCLMVVSLAPRHMATYHSNLAQAKLTLLKSSVEFCALYAPALLCSVAFILRIALQSMVCATPKGEGCCCDWVSNVHKHTDMEVIANQNQPLS